MAGAALGGILGAFAADEERCLRKLEEAKAISPQSALKPEEAGIEGVVEEAALCRLVELRGLVEKTKDGRYYIKRTENKR